MVASSARWLLLVVCAELLSQRIVCGCTSTAGISILNASLARCLQRCRDSVVGCERIAYNNVANQCAINVGQAGCGAGWTLHTPTASCGFGRGKVTGICTNCPKGTASHALVGDLAGRWDLKTVDGSAAGQLQVSSGGLATYSDGIQGQFILFHSRADPNYPGAFFLEQSSNTPGALQSFAGSGLGWEYAWVEDNNGTTQLVVRRFCGLGPGPCAQQMSPEGSPYFADTLLGTSIVDSGATLPCPLLDGSAPGGITGSCCNAIGQISGTVDDHYSGSFSVGSQVWQDVTLITAQWNSAISPAAMKALQNSAIAVPGSELCQNDAVSVSLNNAVVFVLRGTCEFAEKASKAQQAGALAVIVVNDDRPLPPDLKRETFPQDPSIPTWMIDKPTGSAISSAFAASSSGSVTFLGKSSSANSVALRGVCCESACLSRGFAAKDRAGVPDVAAACAVVDCTGYAPQATTPATSLPQSSDICEACESGLASTIEGRASCGPCFSGGTSDQGGTQCAPCAVGRAGTRGTCLQCPAGKAADSLKVSCITTPTPAPTPPPPTAPPPTPPPTPPPEYAGPDRYKPSDASAVSAGDDGGVPWGIIILILVLLLVCCGCCMFGYHMYSSHSEDIEQRGFAGALGSALGLKGFSNQGSSSREQKEDAETGDSDDKNAESIGNGGADSTTGGGSKGKSMTLGGVKINFT